ncbi:MAG: hypothetical protein KDA58_13335 [Planctomycetaceae bacterium]|nr:hypothetical protein [Planctomycetaceae bacterium]
MKQDPLERFDQMAACASGEAAPSTAVVDRVLDTLHQRSRIRAIRESKYALFGYGSVIAACAALILFMMSTGNDPLVALASPFLMELP